MYGTQHVDNTVQYDKYIDNMALQQTPPSLLAASATHRRLETNLRNYMYDKLKSKVPEIKLSTLITQAVPTPMHRDAMIRGKSRVESTVAHCSSTCKMMQLQPRTQADVTSYTSHSTLLYISQTVY